MRIVIVTDAWHPQVNGVVRTLETTGRQLVERGHEVLMITPDQFRTIPCPTYKSIHLAMLPRKRVARMLSAFEPHAIHVATEGPLGHAARAYCRRRDYPFTTSFHTQFPEYIRLRVPLPIKWSYAYLRSFHAAAAKTFVPTESQRQRLVGWHFENLVLWARGVDAALFKPGPKDLYDLPRPVQLYVGRVAVEKNIETFLKLDEPGTKVVIGDGPDLAKLKGLYPAVKFLGAKIGEDLAAHVAAADVFVFPSLTDTFGLVLLEAMACGVPVAAFPVTGPIDVVRDGETGSLNQDLGQAVRTALTLDAQDCIRYARENSWERWTAVFEENLATL